MNKKYEMKLKDFTNADDFDEDFSSEQIREIALGCIRGVGVSVYADPRYNVKTMMFVRESFQCGVTINYNNILAWNSCDAEVLQILINIMHRNWNVNVDALMNPELSVEQAKALHRAVIHTKIDPTPYADPKYDPKCMDLYTYALKEGLSIGSILDPRLNTKDLGFLIDVLMKEKYE